MSNGSLLGRIEDEFEGAELGDGRLTNRMLMLAAALDEAPKASLSLASKTVAAREGAYRFVENAAVTMEALLEPHRRKTAERCKQAKSVYIVSDTSEFVFTGETRGAALGRIQGKRRGFLGHVALAVSAEGDRRPLGILGVQTLVREEEKKAHRNTRQQKRDPNRESLRWGEMAKKAESVLDGVNAIHVMDREADIFELIADLRRRESRFVIRSGQNRTVFESEKLAEAVLNAPTMLEREVKLSARPKTLKISRVRGQSVRLGRPAILHISRRSVTIARPKTTESSYPESLSVNVVHVFEKDAPPDESPVNWLLFTSESVDTRGEIAAVVDAYRARWTIEEYFKALKTGCAFESRQLRSIHTLTNALGLLAVVAYRLLLLRTLERTAPDTPAAEVLDPMLLEALAARLRKIREPKPFPSNASVADVMKGIARLGGHHKSNGPPGWQLLWAGFQDLLTWAAGYTAGRSAT
jgi:hypothetical protein